MGACCQCKGGADRAHLLGERLAVEDAEPVVAADCETAVVLVEACVQELIALRRCLLHRAPGDVSSQAGTVYGMGVRKVEEGVR